MKILSLARSSIVIFCQKILRMQRFLSDRIRKYGFKFFVLLNLQMRDLRAVGNKFYHVLIPREKSSLLKECKYIFNKY